MKNAILFMMFVAGSGKDDFPSAEIQTTFREFSQERKESLWEYYKSINLVEADELCDWDCFEGATNVIRRRLLGRPFPYPTDPRLGQRIP